MIISLNVYFDCCCIDMELLFTYISPYFILINSICRLNKKCFAFSLDQEWEDVNGVLYQRCKCQPLFRIFTVLCSIDVLFSYGFGVN